MQGNISTIADRRFSKFRFGIQHTPNPGKVAVSEILPGGNTFSMKYMHRPGLRM